MEYQINKKFLEKFIIRTDCLFFKDLSHIYNSFRKEKTELTEYFKGTDIVQNFHIAYFSLNKDIDICFSQKNVKWDKNTFVLKTHSDAIFDIKIKNATYANYMPSGNVSFFPFSLEKRNDFFVFEGAELDSPLFNCNLGSSHIFDTDGDYIEYKEIWIKKEKKEILENLNECFTVSKIGKNFFLLGKNWRSSLILSEEDIFKQPFPL